MYKVLFVCLGNICRSPLAEAIFKHKVEERKLAKYLFVDSCGTSNYHIGDPPDERTIANARQNGININHRGRQLGFNDLEKFDLLLAMDKSNLLNIQRLDNSGLYHAKINLMRAFDDAAPQEDVPDPYYGNADGFQHVFEILDRSTHGLLDYLEAEKLSNLKF